MIALIVAAAGKKQVIGKDGDLPWHFSTDLKFFKETTMGHAVLMGRKTYQSILKRLGKPLPGRRNIVITRNESFKDDRVEVIHRLSDIPRDADTLYVIGGAEIFEQTLNMADAIHFTAIDKEIEGDTFFPLLNPHTWHLTEERVETEKDTTLRFQTYKRIH